MRVVVTRPELSARRTAARLVELGHAPVLLPMSQPVHKPDAAIAALRARHSALAMTSAEAIRTLAHLGAALASHRSTPVLAVGKATAEAATAIGFEQVVNGGGSGEQLAEIAAGHRRSDMTAPLLYLAGKPRSPHFENGLAARGIGFRTAEIYEMIPTNHAAATLRHALTGIAGGDRDNTGQEPSAVLLYSKETARLFFTAAETHGEALASMRFLCLSDAVATAIPETFRRHAMIAEQPDEEHLLRLL